MKGLDGNCKVVEPGMSGGTSLSGQPYVNPDGSRPI